MLFYCNGEKFDPFRVKHTGFIFIHIKPFQGFEEKYLSFETMEFSLSDPNFCIQLLMDCPFASNHEDETMLSDFLIEHYKMPDEAWHRELTGGIYFGEEETEPWNGTSLTLRINGKVNLLVEFHYFETIYFFNDLYLGNTGGHYHLSLFTWAEFLKIVQNREQENLLFFLLFPLVVGSKTELPAIEQELNRRLKELPLKQEHIPIIAKYLCGHTVFEDDEERMFLEDPQKGTVCKRNYSERSPEKDTQDLITINVAILSAMES